MENYRVYYQEGEQEDILRILRRSSDVVIDNINHNSIGITVERDDAERFYVQLLDQIHREVYDFRQLVLQDNPGRYSL
ncbi:MAG TPA: hypothetical protein VGD40_00760 [Chryseosolibacter sp.]